MNKKQETIGLLLAEQWQLFTTMDEVDKVAVKLEQVYIEQLRLIKKGEIDVQKALKEIGSWMFKFKRYGAADTEPEVYLLGRMEKDLGLEEDRLLNEFRYQII